MRRICLGFVPMGTTPADLRAIDRFSETVDEHPGYSEAADPSAELEPFLRTERMRRFRAGGSR